MLIKSLTTFINSGTIKFTTSVITNIIIIMERVIASTLSPKDTFSFLLFPLNLPSKNFIGIFNISAINAPSTNGNIIENILLKILPTVFKLNNTQYSKIPKIISCVHFLKFLFSSKSFAS